MAREIFQNLILHACDFGTIPTRYGWKLFRGGGHAQLGRQTREISYALLSRFQFLIVVNHILTSTIPRRVRSRLVCQCRINSSRVSRINIEGRSQKMLAPNSCTACVWSKSFLVSSSQAFKLKSSRIIRITSTSFGSGLAVM